MRPAVVEFGINQRQAKQLCGDLLRVLGYLVASTESNFGFCVFDHCSQWVKETHICGNEAPADAKRKQYLLRPGYSLFKHAAGAFFLESDAGL